MQIENQNLFHEKNITNITNDYESTQHLHNEKRTLWVVYLTAVTMLGEIFFGYLTKSMALLADGFHMASHVFALGLSWIAYVVARKYAKTE
ncbi:MAG: cation transporter, partial [Bacteroidales bacterium]|nr:cation transporter [Bacteroidales bacterium]